MLAVDCSMILAKSYWSCAFHRNISQVTSGCLRASECVFPKLLDQNRPLSKTHSNSSKCHAFLCLTTSYDQSTFFRKCQLGLSFAVSNIEGKLSEKTGLKGPIVLSPAAETVVCVGFVAVKELLIEPVKESVYEQHLDALHFHTFCPEFPDFRNASLS